MVQAVDEPDHVYVPLDRRYAGNILKQKSAGLRASAAPDA